MSGHEDRSGAGPAAVPADPVEVEFDAERRHYELAWQQLWPWEKRVGRTLLPALLCLAILVLESRRSTYGAGLAVGVAACALGMMANQARVLRGEAGRSWQAHFDRPIRYRFRFGPEGLDTWTENGTRHYRWSDVLGVARGPEVITFTYRQPVVIWVPSVLLVEAEQQRVEAWWRAARETARQGQGTDRGADRDAPTRPWWRGRLRSELAVLTCFLLPVVAGMLAPAGWSFYQRHYGAFPCRLLTDGEIEDAVGAAPTSREVAPDPFAQVPGVVPAGVPDACYWLLPQGEAEVPPQVSLRVVQDGAALYRSSIEPTPGTEVLDIVPGTTGRLMVLEDGQAVALMAGDRLVVLTVTDPSVPDQALRQLVRAALERLG